MFQRAAKPTALYTPQEVRSKLEVALSAGEDAARAAIRSDLILWRSAARDSRVIWGNTLLSLPSDDYVQDDDLTLAYHWPELWGTTGNLREAIATAQTLGLPDFFGSKLERSMLSLLSSGVALRRRICETEQSLGLDDYQRALVRITSPKPSSEHYQTALFAPLEALIIAASDYYVVQTRLCELYAAQTGQPIGAGDVSDVRRQIVPRIVRAATGKNTDYHVAMTYFLEADEPVTFRRSSQGRLVIKFGDLPDFAEEFYRQSMAQKDPDFVAFLDSSTLHTGCPMLQAKLDGKTFLTSIVTTLAKAAEQDLEQSSYVRGAPDLRKSVQQSQPDFMPK